VAAPFSESSRSAVPACFHQSRISANSAKPRQSRSKLIRNGMLHPACPSDRLPESMLASCPPYKPGTGTAVGISIPSIKNTRPSTGFQYRLIFLGPRPSPRRIGARKFDDENRSGFGSVSRRWILPPLAMPRPPNRAPLGQLRPTEAGRAADARNAVRRSRPIDWAARSRSQWSAGYGAMHH
jgi:hypothetical protein